MDLSPYDQCRSDVKQCSLGRSCNVITLGLTLILISGFAIADNWTVKCTMSEQHEQIDKK